MVELTLAGWRLTPDYEQRFGQALRDVTLEART
jgi:hypothetical protein